MSNKNNALAFKNSSPARFPFQKIILIFFAALLLSPVFPPGFLYLSASPAEPGPCLPASQTLTYQEIEIAVHYPISGSCSDGTTAPFPTIIFAHSFTAFGISDGLRDNRGNGEHLASWGYVFVIPRLPEDAETRAGIVLQVLDYLETIVADPASFLYRLVDTDHLGSAGHSLGGSTALAIAARDHRIKTVVALDPVFHTGGPGGGSGDMVWDPYLEGPDIQVPTAILGAPPDPCNANGDYQLIYPLIGARLKASYLLVGANHWVFADPGNRLLSLFCEGSTDPFLTILSQKYMTAWFNYYLYQKPGDYHYLYGLPSHEDVTEGWIVMETNVIPGQIYIPSLQE